MAAADQECFVSVVLPGQTRIVTAGRFVLRCDRRGDAVGSARPKATLEEVQCLWLAKFPRPDDHWNQPRVEYATLQLDRRWGIQVPECRLERLGERDVLVVRRFDRD